MQVNWIKFKNWWEVVTKKVIIFGTAIGIGLFLTHQDYLVFFNLLTLWIMASILIFLLCKIKTEKKIGMPNNSMMINHNQVIGL